MVASIQSFIQHGGLIAWAIITPFAILAVFWAIFPLLLLFIDWRLARIERLLRRIADRG